MTAPAEGIVHLHRAEEDADALLRTRIAHLLGLDPADVLTGRACPRCGSSAHGRPWARAGGVEVFVSLSRCGEHLLTAVSVDGPVGVDIEAIAAVERGWDPLVVLHPSERAASERAAWPERAALWARKEALLKALGTGLATPMEAVQLDAHHVVDLPAPPGHVAALARL